MTKKEWDEWVPEDSLCTPEWDINHDHFNVEIEMSEAKIHKAPVVFPDIKTCLDMMSMISKLTPALAKLDTLDNNELEIAEEKIINFNGYSQKEKDYLLNKIYEKKM